MSCNKQLDKLPDNRTVITTVDQVTQLLVAAYPHANYIPFMEPMSDNAEDKGTAPATADPEPMDAPDDLGADDPAAAGESVDAATEPVQTSAQPQQQSPPPAQAATLPRKRARVRSRVGGYSATKF